MAPRKRKEITTPVTDAQLAETATVAHEQHLADTDLVPIATGEPDGVPLYPSTPGELRDDQGVVPPAQEPHQPETHQSPAETHHPATARGHSERFPGRRSVDGHVVGGVKLNLIDDGNYGGMGIQVDVEQPSDKPTPDETAVLKDGGFRYKGGEWRAGIDRRDPAGSRNAHHATYGRFVDKFREREGGGQER